MLLVRSHWTQKQLQCVSSCFSLNCCFWAVFVVVLRPFPIPYIMYNISYTHRMCYDCMCFNSQVLLLEFVWTANILQCDAKILLASTQVYFYAYISHSMAAETRLRSITKSTFSILSLRPCCHAKLTCQSIFAQKPTYYKNEARKKKEKERSDQRTHTCRTDSCS